MPAGRHRAIHSSPQAGDAVSRPASGVRAEGRRPGPEDHRRRRRSSAAENQGSVLRQGRQVRRELREEVPRSDCEAEAHRRAGARGRPRQRDPEQDLREGHGGRRGLGQGDRGLLQEEQAAVRTARQPRRAAHPRQEEVPRRPAPPAAAERRGLRSARQEVLGGPELEDPGWEADRLQGAAGAGVRQGRVLAQDP